MIYENVKPPLMAEIVKTNENQGSNEEIPKEGGKKEPSYVTI